LDLIERVDARIHAPAVQAPGPADWPSVSAARDAYRHVRLTGHFLNDRETLVSATTELGIGYWVMTPLETDRGFVVLVNRGFVPPERSRPTSRIAGQIDGPTEVTGLLRLSEPGGGFLRANAPSAGLWYSRDVSAIAAAKALTEVAPYFVDADRNGAMRDGPVGGLTVVAFPNNHLVYALTWFALALMSIAGAASFARANRGNHLVEQTRT